MNKKKTDRSNYVASQNEPYGRVAVPCISFLSNVHLNIVGDLWQLELSNWNILKFLALY